VLLIVEITDVTFAVDSIPAIFGITRDPFIVYTSNVSRSSVARALFPAADVLDYFHYSASLGPGADFYRGKNGGRTMAPHLCGALLKRGGRNPAAAVLISVFTRPTKKKEPGTG